MTTFAFSTTEYEAAHGRTPKGNGRWAFYIGERLWFAPHSLTYFKACRAAKREARRMMETGELNHTDSLTIKLGS